MNILGMFILCLFIIKNTLNLLNFTTMKKFVKLAKLAALAIGSYFVFNGVCYLVTSIAAGTVTAEAVAAATLGILAGAILLSPAVIAELTEDDENGAPASSALKSALAA